MSFYHDLYDALLRGCEVTVEVNGAGELPNIRTVRSELSRVRAEFKRQLGKDVDTKNVQIVTNPNGSITLRLVTPRKVPTFIVRPAADCNKETSNEQSN